MREKNIIKFPQTNEPKVGKIEYWDGEEEPGKMTLDHVCMLIKPMSCHYRY